MNPIINQMHAHRSIRAYTGEVMPDSELHAAFEAAQCASTSANVQVYSVVRVTDKETLQAMLAMMQEYDEHMAAYYERRGASGRRWIGQMEHFFAKPRRTGDRSFYESQGASLE